MISAMRQGRNVLRRPNWAEIWPLFGVMAAYGMGAAGTDIRARPGKRDLQESINAMRQDRNVLRRLGPAGLAVVGRNGSVWYTNRENEHSNRTQGT